MPQIVKAGSIQLDVPNIVPAGSIELDKESDGSVLRTASGLAHTARAVAETGAGVVTGLAAFPISKGTKWIEYALSGGDLDKAKAAEQRANERIQFAPTTTEAQGALEKLGKYALDPVFRTLREAGRIPGEAWNNETMMELGGDVAEIGVPIKAHGMLKTQRAYRAKTPVTEIIEPKAPEVISKPIEKPVIVKAKSIELDKPEVKVEPKIEPQIEPVVEPKIIPAESIKLDPPEVKAEGKPEVIDGEYTAVKAKGGGYDIYKNGVKQSVGANKATDISQVIQLLRESEKEASDFAGILNWEKKGNKHIEETKDFKDYVVEVSPRYDTQNKQVGANLTISRRNPDGTLTIESQKSDYATINEAKRDTVAQVKALSQAKTATSSPKVEAATKVIPTTKKAEANVVSPKEQKTYVLDKVDGLITEARARWKDEYGSKHPDKEIDEKMLKGTFGDDTAKLRGLEPTIVIEVPNDGRYKIPNTLNALLNFQKKFKALKTSTEVPDIKPPMPSKKPTGKPLEQIEKEAFEDHQQYLNQKEWVRNEYNAAVKNLADDKKTYNTWKEIERKIDDKEIKPNLKRGRESYDISGWGVFSPDEIGVKIRELRANVNSAELRVQSAKSDIYQKYQSMYNEMFGKKESKGVQLNSGLDPTIAIDIMKTISAKTSEIIEANKMTPSVARGVKAAKDAMIEQDRNVRRAESTSKLFEKTVQDIVPKPERQMEMVHAYEHKMKGKAWDGLTEIEKGVVRWAAEEKAKLNKYIKDNDILETMPESDSINHIFHHWIDKETGKPYKAMYGKFSKGLPQAKQRVIPTYEAGIKNGMTPATTNIGKLIGMEWEAATRANNARQLFKTLHGIKGDENMSIVLSKGGKPQPIRMVESWSNLEKQGLTDGYVRYDNNFLDKAMTFESSDGRLITMKGAVGVKEELYPFVHAYIDSPQYGKLSELNFASKSLTLGASLFHPVSLGMQELANLRTPFVHIPQGLRIIKELGPEVRLLHQEGLELFKGYEDLGFKNQFFDDGSTLGKTGNVITWPISKMRDFIFDYVQPGMKVSFAHAMFTKMLPKYLEGTKFTAEEVMAMYESGKPLPPEALQCAREVVQKADGHFSGEHYKRSLLETNRFMVKLYFTPEARVKWQAALLSPTWQREHLLVAKNVMKSFMPDKMIKKLGMAELGPIKSQYRLYALGAAMIIGAVDLWNYNSSLIMDGEGKHLWQNPTGKGFAVRAWWNEPAYTIQDKNGRYKYIPEAPAYIRPLKSVFEVAEWAHDPVLKLGYKLSPVLSALGEQLFGQKKYVGLPDIPKRALDFIVDSSTPIVVDQAIRTAQGKQSIQATALPFIGMPVSRLKQMNYKSNPEGN